MSRKPGDWNCSSCQHLNFSWRESCQRCSDPKQEKSCGAHNFASRTNCFKCGAPKDDNEEAMDGRGGGGYESGWSGGSYERGSSRGGSYYDSGNAGAAGGRAGWKSGDWMCTRPGCNEHNFASRMECFRCQSRRED